MCDTFLHTLYVWFKKKKQKLVINNKSVLCSVSPGVATVDRHIISSLKQPEQMYHIIVVVTAHLMCTLKSDMASEFFLPAEKHTSSTTK